MTHSTGITTSEKIVSTNEEKEIGSIACDSTSGETLASIAKEPTCIRVSVICLPGLENISEKSFNGKEIDACSTPKIMNLSESFESMKYGVETVLNECIENIIMSEFNDLPSVDFIRHTAKEDKVESTLTLEMLLSEEMDVVLQDSTLPNLVITDIESDDSLAEDVTETTAVHSPAKKQKS